ncbi:WD40 repeat-like protein [Atractiella rhizophila]|nr:WD40 repeat-like protein [Atractiella rhizophila]
MTSKQSQAGPTQIETQHEDMIHDAQLDYYSTRLATCSSDRTVKIFDILPDGSHKLIDTLRGHEGPVWQLSFAHPSFGNILASCSYDGKVIVWKETEHGGGWNRIKEHTLHSASVNSISWAPHELGPILACASSDGKVSVLTFNNDGTWDAQMFPAHTIGANAVSWAPATPSGSLVPSTAPRLQNQASTVTKIRRFASGGCDGMVKLWAWREDSKSWAEEDVLEGHSDWVRDVAWAPNIGLPKSYIATAGQDKQVIIWTQDSPKAAWSKTHLQVGNSNQFPDVVWRVSWSVAGNVLAVASGDGKVTLWKEDLKGKWENVSDVVA